MKLGDRVGSGTVYTYTESSESTKEGMGEGKEQKKLWNKRKRGEQS